MEQIELSDRDKALLRENYPGLRIIGSENVIRGILVFNLTYIEKTIKGKFNIEFYLSTVGNKILPIVRETNGEILKIAKRKNIDLKALHVNNEEGELCLIIPPKENKRYPSGFDLKEFLHHIEEHLYWVSFYDRFEKPPWKAQAHGDDGYIELYHEDKSFRPDVIEVLQNRAKHKLSRPEIRRIIRNRKL